jgi:hypothetical protein
LFAGNILRAAPGFTASGAAVFVPAGSTTVARCTFIANEAYGTPAIAGISVSDTGGFASVENSIIAFNIGNPCAGAGLSMRCVDVFGNSDGDTICDMGTGGNFSLDPEFCATGESRIANPGLQSDSPCAENHPGGMTCGVIGVAGVACGTTSVQSSTWSTFKSLYRR